MRTCWHKKSASEWKNTTRQDKTKKKMDEQYSRRSPTSWCNDAWRDNWKTLDDIAEDRQLWTQSCRVYGWNQLEDENLTWLYYMAIIADYFQENGQCFNILSRAESTEVETMLIRRPICRSRTAEQMPSVYMVMFQWYFWVHVTAYFILHVLLSTILQFAIYSFY